MSQMMATLRGRQGQGRGAMQDGASSTGTTTMVRRIASIRISPRSS